MSNSRGWQVARVLGYGVVATAVGALTSAGVLLGQAQQARRDIPRAQDPPPPGGGRYGAKLPGEPLTLVVLGDSSAAGYGVDKPRQTPGALLATGIFHRLGRPVQLHRLAVVGATSTLLAPQVEAALERRPDLAVILIGGNDVTHRADQAAAVRELARAVQVLRAAGAEVVVGTCPDLGTIEPIPRPLRWLARRWSRQLAAAQTVAVVEAGGRTVSLGDLLGPRFAAEPHRMFGRDRFHPSAEGYAAAAAALLPTAVAALGGPRPRLLTGTEALRSLPSAAVEASQHAGTEVSGASIGGRERALTGGRWAALRRSRYREPAAHTAPSEAAPPEAAPPEAAPPEAAPPEAAPPEAAPPEAAPPEAAPPDAVTLEVVPSTPHPPGAVPSRRHTPGAPT